MARRPSGCLPLLLGWAVIGYVVFQTVAAWWRAHRDELVSGAVDQILRSSTLVLVAVVALFVAGLRARAMRAPARGVSSPVTLAGLDPPAGARVDGAALEQLTAELIVRDGGNARRTGGAGDGGVDVAGTTAQGRPVIVGCKQYAADAVIGPAQVRELIGAGRLAGSDPLIIFVTTAGRFSAQAAAEGRAGGVVLIDRQRLSAWMAGARLAELGPARTSWAGRARTAAAYGRAALDRRNSRGGWLR